MPCPDCKHKEHQPGQCKSCNCGDGEITHSTSAIKLTIDQDCKQFGGGSSLTMYGYNKGRRVPKRRTDNQ
jgi:hypothetical protein